MESKGSIKGITEHQPSTLLSAIFQAKMKKIDPNVKKKAKFKISSTWNPNVNKKRQIWNLEHLDPPPPIVAISSLPHPCLLLLPRALSVGHQGHHHHLSVGDDGKMMMMFTIIIIPMVVTLSFLLLLQRAVSVGDDVKMKIIVIMMKIMMGMVNMIITKMSWMRQRWWCKRWQQVRWVPGAASSSQRGLKGGRPTFFRASLLLVVTWLSSWQN